MRTDVIVLAILLMPWNVAFAQTACPQGVAAGSAQCGPSSLVNPGDSDYRSKATALPQEKWSDSWGAIASDGNGVAGIATDFPRKRKAMKGEISGGKKQGEHGREAER